MNNNDYRNNGYEQNDNKTRTVWINIGIGALAVFLAVLTVVVINI